MSYNLNGTASPAEVASGGQNPVICHLLPLKMPSLHTASSQATATTTMGGTVTTASTVSKCSSVHSKGVSTAALSAAVTGTPRHQSCKRLPLGSLHQGLATLSLPGQSSQLKANLLSLQTHLVSLVYSRHMVLRTVLGL